MKILDFKKIGGILLIIFFSNVAAYADNFCNGYEEGYKDGFRNAIGIEGLDPMVPICPVPSMSEFEEAERDYQKGYQRGYNEGSQKGKEKT